MSILIPSDDDPHRHDLCDEVPLACRECETGDWENLPDHGPDSGCEDEMCEECFKLDELEEDIN